MRLMEKVVVVEVPPEGEGGVAAIAKTTKRK